MKTNLTRILALVLVLALALSVAACGNKTPDATEGNNSTEGTNATDATDATDGTEGTEGTSGNTSAEGNMITFFSLTYGENEENMIYLNASAMDDTTASFEYMGTVRKVGELEISALQTLTEEFNKTQLASLNGQDVYNEGTAMGSMYVELADGTCLSVSYSGTSLPEAYTTGFAAMDACFQTLTAEIPEYVPQAAVVGEVDADRLAVMQEVLNNSGFPNLDGLMISEIPMDVVEDFCFSAGLSSTDGIVGGSLGSAQMMTTAFSFVVVTVEDESKIDAVRADFENTMDWTKWVCVSPTDAVIAQKGNMVLCLLGSDILYTGCKTAIENAGWENLATFQNPEA